MLYTLNNNYVLRQELNDCYRLYNKKTLRSYTISYKLFFILEQFRKQSYSLEHLIEEFNVRNIDLSDFYHFIEKDEFFDLLVMANNFKGPFVKYKISKDLSSYTAYSPERVDFLITKHCNLACKHCFEGSSPSFEVKRISSSDTDRILSQFEAANIQTLKITGGEPFSHPDIDNFLFKAIQCHFETIILTNALLLNKQRIDMILKSATKLFSVLLASKRPLITELADKLRLKYPLLPTISPCPTMRLEAIRSIIPISCRRYPKSV